MEDWVPTLSAGPLLGIAAAAIALIWSSSLCSSSTLSSH